MKQIVLKYFHTVRYLRWIQIKYRLLGMIYQPKLKPLHSSTAKRIKNRKIDLKLQESISGYIQYFNRDKFLLLNIENSFNGQIDWNISKFGKLWTYNLSYFEFLTQSDLTKEQGLRLIHDFVSKESEILDGMEPYPISLRSIFWIRFLRKHNVLDQKIDQSLYRQLSKLSARPEYHLMGNHLLENGVALLFGGSYFSDDSMGEKGQEIIIEQLEEQILTDGAHFELSPMYHLILLYRLLDCYNLIKNNPQLKLDLLEDKLTEKCAKMLGWIQNMQFDDGTVPNVNDSTNFIAPSIDSIKYYAAQLGLKAEKIALGESGYRRIRKGKYEVIFDIGSIGPDYIPGHAHSDTFNFVMHFNNKPLIVDTGISTYEKNDHRQVERSTAAHNTVLVNGKEQSAIWGGFRVAERAKITELIESSDKISAKHDGYKKLGIVHKRTFDYSGNTLHITDHLSQQTNATAYLHFDPSVKVIIVDGEIHSEFGKITFAEHNKLQIANYDKALGFNKIISAQMAIITFSRRLDTTIIPS